MLKPYDLLKNILLDIENSIKEDINSDILAEKYALSPRHLQRLFKFAFNQTLGSYIRSRKLAASIDALLKPKSKILDIALEFGFEYEQSYAFAFKREFGITPGDLRKSGYIVKIKPPLHLFDENKFPEGLFFGPEIVMVPQFNIMGTLHNIPYSDAATLAAEVAKNFWQNERGKIKKAKNGDVYIGLTRINNNEFSKYLTGVQVENFKNMPEGFSGDTFETSLCIKFRYIGQHHYYEINAKIAHSMYEAIKKYNREDQSKYILLDNKVYFERIDTNLYDGTYCQMEWFTPVVEK